jgi:hypothetical protein
MVCRRQAQWGLGLIPGSYDPVQNLAFGTGNTYDTGPL